MSMTRTSTARGTDRPARVRHHSARRRAAVSAAAGLLAAGVMYAVRLPELAPMVGWLLAGLTFLTWTWTTIWPRDADQTSQLAVVEDPTRPLADGLVLSAAVAAMLAVALVIAKGSYEPARLGLGLLSIVVSWA